MENNKQYHSISFGVFLLFVGTVALLTNIDIINWSTLLDFVLRYWPVFIILAGIKMVGNARIGKFFGLVVDVLFFIAVILGLVFAKGTLLPTVETEVRETKTESVQYSDYAGATSANYLLSFGAADFEATDQTSDKYLTMSGQKDFTLEPTLLSGNIVQIEAKNNPLDKYYRFPNINSAQKFDLEFGVTELDSTIDVSTGASSGTMKLDEMKLSSLTSKVGAGELTMELTNKAVAKRIDISVGAGRTVLKIVGQHTVRVTYSLGAGDLKIKSASTNLDKNFGGIGANGVYETSPNPEIEVHVSIGAGEVEVLLD